MTQAAQLIGLKTLHVTGSEWRRVTVLALADGWALVRPTTGDPYACPAKELQPLVVELPTSTKA
jgi:hypothetical protein